MNATQFEALVIRAVDAVRAGANPEDDRIEFKRAWPEVAKARQLAAAANQAQGDHIIYVIGIDDNTGIVYPLDDTDPADWWAQIEARFDEVAPDLVRHLGVQVSDTERVVGLLFRTDRAPYVVKVGANGGGELEVPIRAGTRTRSAKRHELIRMLYPSAGLPRLTVVSARLEQNADFTRQEASQVLLWLDLQVLFEPSGTSPAFLPWHSATATLDGGGQALPGEVVPTAKPGDASDAVHLRPDGIRVSEPGVARIGARWSFPVKRARKLREVDRWSARMAFAVTGSDRRIAVEAALGDRRTAALRSPGMRQDDDLAEWRWTLEPSAE